MYLTMLHVGIGRAMSPLVIPSSSSPVIIIMVEKGFKYKNFVHPAIRIIGLLIDDPGILFNLGRSFRVTARHSIYYKQVVVIVNKPL